MAGTAAAWDGIIGRLRRRMREVTTGVLTTASHGCRRSGSSRRRDRDRLNLGLHDRRVDRLSRCRLRVDDGRIYRLGRLGLDDGRVNRLGWRAGVRCLRRFRGVGSLGGFGGDRGLAILGGCGRRGRSRRAIRTFRLGGSSRRVDDGVEGFRDGRRGRVGAEGQRSRVVCPSARRRDQGRAGHKGGDGHET